MSQAKPVLPDITTPAPILRRGKLSRTLVDLFTPILVSLAILVIGEWLVKEQHDQRDREQEQQIQHVAGQLRATLEAELNATLHLASGLEAYIKVVKGNAKQDEIGKVLAALFDQSKYLHNIGIAPNNRIKFVFPQALNSKAVGLYYPDNEEQWPAVRRAMIEHRPTLAGPHKLRQGGVGLIYHVPVYLDDHYWGVVSTVINSMSLFEDVSSITNKANMEFALRGANGLGATGALFWGDKALFSDENSFKLDVFVPGGQWLLAVRRNKTSNALDLYDWLRFVGWLFTAVIGFTLYLGLRAHHRNFDLAQQLQQTEERYRYALRAIKDGLWEWHYQTGGVQLDEHCRNILGLPDDLEKADYHALLARMSPLDAEETLTNIKESLRNHEPFTVQYRTLGKDNQWVWVESRGSVIDWTGDKPRSIIGTMSDITLRKEAEESQQIAAVAFESQEGMIVTDANGLILRVNKAFEEITGYSSEDAVGQNPSFLQSGKHHSEFYERMWHGITHHDHWRGEIWDRRKNGEAFPVWLTVTAVKNHRGEPTHYVSTFSDISKRVEAEEQIRNLAFYDPLTGLPNRRLLTDRLSHAIANSERTKNHAAIMMLDLDHFKTLNDTQGHDVGDLLLNQVAQRLTDCLREGDTVARLGGDEFIVVLENLSQVDSTAIAQTELIAEKIRAALNMPYLLKSSDNNNYHNTPSIGVRVFCGHDNPADTLLKQADIAMYEAKDAGRNVICFYSGEMQTALDQRATLEADLRATIANNGFTLFYQPQVNADLCIIGAEALIRWQPPGKTTLQPPTFIPLAEETGLILPIGQWVLETACAQLAAWAKMPHTCDLVLSINVSARQFHQPNFVGQILDALATYKIKPSRLKLELTESLVLEHIDDTTHKMNQLRTKGIGFSLDDFGTGYSSLAYLKRLPLDQIKIDQSFVRDITTDINDAAIVQTIISMGQTLDLDVIAEGVETTDQRDFLKKNGCTEFQGYLFGKPMSAADFNALIVSTSISE